MQRHFLWWMGIILIMISSCRQPVSTFPSSSLQLVYPTKDYGALFDSVQLSNIFPDSKTFPDCMPHTDPETIREAFAAKPFSNSDLATFIDTYFSLPELPQTNFQTDTSMDVLAHIDRLWPILSRKDDRLEAFSSRIPLPYPYIVPGGRFREIYYWDSYFTMLGLKESDDAQYMIRNMIENFAFLIDTIGFIPNGNRTYYLSRSQPPFFGSMVSLLSTLEGKYVMTEFLPMMEKEYNFWMSGTEANGDWVEAKHVVKMKDAEILNRYFDNTPAPRPEAYKEDVAIALESDRSADIVHSHIRAACESGWDFSSRWFKDTSSLATIQTKDLIPPDLNSLLYQLESLIAEAYFLTEDSTKGSIFSLKAANRKSAILKYLWDEQKGVFSDYHWKSQQISDVPTLATMFPLYFNIAQQGQADQVAAFIEQYFLQAGGVVTTLNETGEQWDAPNGWAPLQWITIQGLRNYGHYALADTIRDRWIALNVNVFERTGRLLEKYNVMDLSLAAGGGEYPLQDGFGWTNGVLAALLTEKIDAARK